MNDELAIEKLEEVMPQMRNRTVLQKLQDNIGLIIGGLFIFVLLILVLIFLTFTILSSPNAGERFDRIRGVNLGGWFVLEPWITPSIFEIDNPNGTIVDEYTFSKVHGKEKAKSILEKHWASWVTREEILQLPGMSINHVRIPVGYWMFGVQPEDPYVDGSLSYLLGALEWMREAKLKVIIDLHGAPGSQNGFDNSGKRGELLWTCCDLKNVKRTLSVIERLTLELAVEKYQGVIVGINLVNEPFLIDRNIIRPFYEQGFEIVQKNSKIKNLKVTISDGFYGYDNWFDFFQEEKYKQKVYMDTHVYYVFDYFFLKKTDDELIKFICLYNKGRIAASNKNIATYIGEWSGTRTDCTKWLNGYGKGARFDGTLSPEKVGSCELEDNHLKWTVKYKEFLRKYHEIQMDAYEASSGWFYWNFKAENSPHWNYMLGVKEGWIPRNPSERKFTCESIFKDQK